MTTSLYLIRHGESQANERDAFLGHYDLDLTDKGRQQAEMTARFLQSIKPDAIYASDLTRAYETARRTADRLGMPIVKSEQLREINAGEWDNLTFATLAERFKESYHTWHTNIGHARCDGGESALELQARVVAEVRRIAEKHAGETVFLFTHATPIRAIAVHCLGKTADEWMDIPWASNASVTRVDYTDGELTLCAYSMDDFMGELTTKLPGSI